jgi:hypothetical protein
VLPQIGQVHPKGFIDTGSEMPGFDNHVYVSVVAVEEMARMIGFVHPAYLEAEVDKLKRELEVAKDQIAEMDAELSAIDVLKNRGYKPAKSAGRPRKVEDADS